MSNEYSREEQNALKTGLYVTLALIALSLFYVSGRKAVEHQESGSYYPVYARFGRTDGLQVGDVVRLAGMPVGKVTAAKLDDKFNAILTLERSSATAFSDQNTSKSNREGRKTTFRKAGNSATLRTPWCLRNWWKELSAWAKPNNNLQAKEKQNEKTSG